MFSKKQLNQKLKHASDKETLFTVTVTAKLTNEHLYQYTPNHKRLFKKILVDGKQFRDHTWIVDNKNYFSSFEEGDTCVFEADIYAYTKSRNGKRQVGLKFKKMMI